MKLLTVFPLALVVALAGCPREREAAIAVTVSIDQGVTSSHAVVTAAGGEISHQTGCMAIAGQRILDVGVAQGDLPDTVMLSAAGFSDADCQHATEPIENAVAIERRFRKGLIIDAPLLLRQVHPSIETACANGLDDDADGQTDCADVDCTDRSCTTGNACVTAQTCSNGSCQGGQQVQCNTPPSSCFMPGGLCVVDAGCRYLATPGTTCEDGNDCTTLDRCDNGGACVGQIRQCTQPPAGQCWAAAGVCVADAGCSYQPAVGTTCNDAENCTVDDRCDGTAGCLGTRVTCAPRECSVPSGSCTADGGCLYTALDAGLACGDGGACNVQGSCLPPFPFVPSNVAINDIPTPPSGKATFNCGTTVIDTGVTGVPTVTNYCPTTPMFGSASITQQGGIATVVLAFEDLEIPGGNTLSIVGVRPVIIVSLKDILVLGAIQVGAGAQACTAAGGGGNGGGGTLSYKSGGGGGGFASVGGAGGSVAAGAAGGAAGAVNLGTQLRGGCPGGLGGGSTARASPGGGALQLVARQTITVAGVISAPGRGGEGGGFGNGGNGGGSGGDLLLEAQQVVASSGGLTCNGGGGGEAGTPNAGQAGQLTTTPARGGTDGIAGGSGGDGAADVTAAQPGEGSSFFAGGGGGGGGLGRIRINVTNSCNIGPQVTLSPAPTSNRPDAGCP